MIRLAVLVLTIAAVTATLDAVAGPPHVRTVDAEGHQIAWQGHGSEWWAREARRARAAWLWQRHRANTLEARLADQSRRLQAHAPAVGALYALRIASAAFRVPYAEMVAVARCETGGDFSPTSYNPSSGASGLLQFLPSTWASDGLAGFSVFDPVANALAAARLVRKDGGWSEWSCGWAAHR